MRNTKALRIIVASLLSSACWSGIAIWLAQRAYIGPELRGGLLVAPLIGIAAGYASLRFAEESVSMRVVFSLLSLYAAATLFGLGMGAFDLAFGNHDLSGWYGPGVLLAPAGQVLFGITFMGFALALWPLAYANHALVARLARGRD
jgi:hypothetical protein